MSIQDLLSADIDVPAPVYLFCPGKPPRGRVATFEAFLADRAVERLTGKVVDPGNRDFAYTAFFADETTTANIVLEAQTLPFLAEKRLVLVRGAEKYDSESSAGPLLSYLENPNESTVLLFVANRVDKRTKFYKACAKAGEVVECPELSVGEVVAWVRKEVRQQERDIEESAARELVQRSGIRLSDVNNALTLVMQYVGDDHDRILEADVIEACADVAEEVVWALTDAISSSNPAGALTALRRLSDLGQHPDALMGTINWMLKNAYHVSTADGEPPISRFVAQKVAPLAKKLGTEKVKAAFALCTDTQFRMRSTGVDGNLALELLVLKLAAPRGRSAA